MTKLRARLRGWRDAVQKRLPPWWSRALAGLLIVIGIVLPFLFSSSSAFMNATIIAVAYAVMSLGLNVVVGFAGLLAFTAAVMGGIGNVRGAVLGGLIIGVIQSLSDSRIGPQWTEAVVFGYLIAIMVLRPAGLLGEETREAG